MKKHRTEKEPVNSKKVRKRTQKLNSFFQSIELRNRKRGGKGEKKVSPGSLELHNSRLI
jgi:hypothetical protein